MVTERQKPCSVRLCTGGGITLSSVQDLASRPPKVSLAARLMRPLARQVVATFPSLRHAASNARPTEARAPIDPAAIEATVARSLRLLCTDVLAVHEPTLHDA